MPLSWQLASLFKPISGGVDGGSFSKSGLWFKKSGIKQEAFVGGEKDGKWSNEIVGSCWVLRATSGEDFLMSSSCRLQVEWQKSVTIWQTFLVCSSNVSGDLCLSHRSTGMKTTSTWAALVTSLKVLSLDSHLLFRTSGYRAVWMHFQRWEKNQHASFQICTQRS